MGWSVEDGGLGHLGGVSPSCEEKGVGAIGYDMK